MKLLRRFWRQPSRPYRDFQIAFTLLTLNFAIPAVSYATAPEMAAVQVREVNRRLGGDPYAAPESQSRVWRTLGASNVMALALMCLLLQVNLRRFIAVLVPLAFLKGYTALLFLLGFASAPRYPVFLAIAILDFATTGAFLFFGRRAWRDIRSRPDADLVPCPLERKA